MKTKDILNKIGWPKDGAKIYLDKDLQYAFFLRKENIIKIGSGKRARGQGPGSAHYALLHECLHFLLERNISYDELIKNIHLREYRVEKRLREICRENKWEKILRSSDRMISLIELRISENPNLKEQENWKPYVFSIERIKAEEKNLNYVY